jgi:hypothetical protein
MPGGGADGTASLPARAERLRLSHDRRRAGGRVRAEDATACPAAAVVEFHRQVRKPDPAADDAGGRLPARATPGAGWNGKSGDRGTAARRAIRPETRPVPVASARYSRSPSSVTSPRSLRMRFLIAMLGLIAVNAGGLRDAACRAPGILSPRPMPAGGARIVAVDRISTVAPGRAGAPRRRMNGLPGRRIFSRCAGRSA